MSPASADDRRRGGTPLGLADHGELAADYGRELGAVPGPVTSGASAETNDPLAGGTCLVRNATDVLEVLATAPGAGGGACGQQE